MGVLKYLLCFIPVGGSQLGQSRVNMLVKSLAEVLMTTMLIRYIWHGCFQ